ncbi:MAG: carbohydrate ABC transporter substrate-binding protein [Anaerolineae bacterium]|nr:carbohydrate ABC transporter substrate-binding protein [Anaerolineae bacterium]
MARKTFVLMTFIVIAALLASCATPTPQIIRETVVVEKPVEKVVQQTVVVEKEKVVKETVVVKETTVVEKEKVVVATPVPKKVVEFAGFYPVDAPYGKEFRLVGYRLEQENPECKFVYSEYPGAEAYKAVTLRAQEGDPVDIDAGGGTSLAPGGGELWKSGLYYDLAKDMKTPAYGQTGGTWLDTFNAAAQKQMIIGESVGSIPYQQTQIILWYNTDHYTKYNLKPPKTWDELMANCETLKKNGISCIGGGGFNGYIGYWYDMILFRLMGNDAQYALYNRTDPKYKWTDPEPVKAAEMLVEMIDKGYTVDGYVGGDFTANQVAYFTGKATHIFIGTWLMGEMKDSIPKDFKQAVIYFPTVKGYEDKTPYEAAFGFINSLGLYKPGTKAKQQHSTECAVKFAKLFTSQEVQTQLVKALDFVSTIKGVPGPENIPGVGELLSGMKLWFPAFQNLSYTAPELRSKSWDNAALLAAKQLTPKQFAEKMQKDWDEFFSRQK